MNSEHLRMNHKLSSVITNKRKLTCCVYDSLLSQCIVNNKHAKHGVGFCIKLLACVPDGHVVT